MSGANVEAVRAMLERGADEFETALAELGDNVEWVIAKEHPNARTLRGREQIVGYLEEWAGMLDDLRFDVDEYRDGGDHVVAIGNARGTGKGGGVPVDVPLTLVYTFDASEVVRVEEFLDADQALAAAGMPAR
jgi:ketosteroid isomerase-like protein